MTDERTAWLRMTLLAAMKRSVGLCRSPPSLSSTPRSSYLSKPLDVYRAGTVNETARPVTRPAIDSITASFGNAGIENCIFSAPFNRSRFEDHDGGTSSTSAASSSP